MGSKLYFNTAKKIKKAMLSHRLEVQGRGEVQEVYQHEEERTQH